MAKAKRRIRPLKITPRDQRIIDSFTDTSWREGCKTPRELVLAATDVRGAGRLSRWIESQTKPLTRKDWNAIVMACTEAIVKKNNTHRTDRATINVLLPFNYRKVCKGFPVGTLIDVPTVLTLLFRINACKLLDFCYESGYSGYNSSMLRRQIGIVEKWYTDFEAALDETELDEHTQFVLTYGDETEVENFISNQIKQKESKDDDNA